MGDEVQLERRGNVARITLNRPGARNALTRSMCAELVTAISSLRTDTTARVVVLRGSGADFTVGADLKDMADLPARPPGQRGPALTQMARELAWPIVRGLHELRQPIVTSVRGHVIGIGVQLALSADLVIASDTARLLLPMARLGHSVDHGESYYLPRRVPLDRAMQMLMLGETWSAGDAERYGLVNWVVPDERLEEKTDEVVQRIAAGAPVAIQEMKSLLRQSLDRTLDEQLAAEVASLGTCAATADFGEAISAFLEKRKPEFTGR
jgi:2-(1,2-epoxy-1,2-dihydrophenyl)acetyl-CoA isomerase